MKIVKSALLSILLVAGISTCTFAQEPAEMEKEKELTVANPNSPEITFEKETHDYGNMKQGADGTCEFKFTNTGKEPLIIGNARGSCGCTVPTFPKEPIMKGQSAVIKVHYDTKRVGAFAKTVTIESNAKTNPKIISIKGTVESVEVESTVPLKKTEEGATPFAK